MSAAKHSPWAVMPWWGAVTGGFLLSVAGQWAINSMVHIIDLGKADLTLGQQALLAGGAVLVASGTALISRGTPERPQGMDPWETFWWGPVTITFNATVVLMSLLCVWVIPEAITVYREAGSASTERPLSVIFVTVVVLITLGLSLGLTHYLRHNAAQYKAEEAGASIASPGGTDIARNSPGASFWAVALLLIALFASSRRSGPSVKARS